MKLLLVFFGEDYHGGTTYSTLTIARELVRRGHEVHAYALVTPAGVLARDLEAAGVKVHDGRAPIMVHPEEKRPLYKVVRLGLELARRFYARPKSERQIAHIIESCGIDLLAISSGAISSGSRAAQKAGIPFVWHIREFMQEDHELDFYPWAHAYERMSEASCLICVSKAVAQKMQRICPNTRTEVVYNGIDTSTFNSEGRTPQAPGGPVRLMFSGGISRSKGTFLILDALSRLGRAVALTLDIYGSEGSSAGQDASSLQERCRELGLEEVVRYQGRSSTIADEYRRHDILIVASRAEAFGRVTVEAMMCGCAVVGSNAGGTPELLADDRGYLFEPNDAESLARALEAAVSDPVERAQRARHAEDFANDRFTVDNYIDGIEAIYQSVLA